MLLKKNAVFVSLLYFIISFAASCSSPSQNHAAVVFLWAAMLTLHYYSNAPTVQAAYWVDDVDHEYNKTLVYSRDLIKEFDVANPPLEAELAWILTKGTKFKNRYRKMINCNLQIFFYKYYEAITFSWDCHKS